MKITTILTKNHDNGMIILRSDYLTRLADLLDLELLE